MKTNFLTSVIVMAGALSALNVSADEGGTNRLSFSARLGFDIKTRFKGVPMSVPSNLRSTPSQPGRPNGDPYNYDDGYVLVDTSENAGGLTSYWGYDDAGQISGNTILLSRSSAAGNSTERSMKEDPSLGAELVYSRQLWVHKSARFGIEAAANYMNLSLDDSSTFNASLTRVTDAYPFTPGTTPPDTNPDLYQGSFMGPGFLMGDTPVSSSTTVISGATLTDRRSLDSDIWGFRLGPYVEFPITDRVSFQLSGGMAVALLHNDVAWSISGTSLSGKGRDCDVLWGGYVAANLSVQLWENWSAVGGVQYQNLGTYEHSFGGRKVELDLSHSFFVTLGVGCSF